MPASSLIAASKAHGAARNALEPISIPGGDPDAREFFNMPSTPEPGAFTSALNDFSGFTPDAAEFIQRNVEAVASNVPRWRGWRQL